MKEIIAEAARDPGLQARVEEATDYANEIRAQQDKALADAHAGSDLAATGIRTKIALDGLKQRLEAGLKGAKSSAEVDELLKGAQ